LNNGTSIDAIAAKSGIPQSKTDSGLVALARDGQLTIETITAELSDYSQCLKG